MASEIEHLQTEIQQGLALEKTLTAGIIFKDAALQLLHSGTIITAPITTTNHLVGSGGGGVINSMNRNDSTTASAHPSHNTNTPSSTSSKLLVPAFKELRDDKDGGDPSSSCLLQCDSQTTSPSVSADNTIAAAAAAQRQSSLASSIPPPIYSDSQQQEGCNEHTDQQVESRQIPLEISRIIKDTFDTYAVQLGAPPSLESPERELEVKSLVQRLTVDQYMGWWASFRDECAELAKRSKEPDVDVAALEQEMKAFWNQRVARFGIILNYRPDLVKELLASAVLPTRHTEEEWREVIIRELELSEEQIVLFERAWEEFEKEMEEANEEGQEALQSLRILSSQGSIPTTPAPAPATGTKTRTAPSLSTHQGFLTMQDLMEAYVLLTHTTGRLEIWEQKKFVGSLKLLNCFASITTLTQKSRMPPLVGPTFPDFINIMGMLGRRKKNRWERGGREGEGGREEDNASI